MQDVTLSPFSLWIVDDDATLVDLLGDSLSSDRRLGHVRTFTCPKAFLDGFRSCTSPPDVAVLDIRMAQINGLTLLRKVRSLCDHTRIVMCSALNDTNTLLDALAEGASGFLVKPATAEELVNAAVHALAGLRPLNVTASTTLVGYLTTPPPLGTMRGSGRLTPRQEQITQLLLEGLDTKSIADRMGLSYHTVIDHFKALFEAFGVHSRVELLARLHRRMDR